MIEITTGELAAVLDAPLQGSPEVRIHGVRHDSRQAEPQALFVALHGGRFDGHDFIHPQLPAAALLVERALEDSRPQVVVPDSLAALTRLATFWRSHCPAQVVALTGSNGKTTTKEMLRAILAQRGVVHATPGNWNNHIGVPLTLLAMPVTADFAVIEMGANHAGEIAALTRCVRPQVALLLNAGRAHLDGFGSLEGVARAKGEIFLGLPPEGGTAVINLDDAFADYWHSLTSAHHRLGFSLGPQGEIRGRWQPPGDLELSVHGTTRTLSLAVPGRHTAANALAAAAAASALGCGIDAIVQGLQHWQPVAGRLRAYRHVSGARIWDDTYNANPESLAAALEVLAAESGVRVLVLGDMNELGPTAAALHAEMGRRARTAGVRQLFALGALTPAAVKAFGAGGHWFSTQEALAEALEKGLRRETIVLVKGSRSQRMEGILDRLELEPIGSTEEAADAPGAR